MFAEDGRLSDCCDRCKRFAAAHKHLKKGDKVQFTNNANLDVQLTLKVDPVLIHAGESYSSHHGIG